MGNSQLQQVCLHDIQLNLIQAQAINDIYLTPNAINNLWQNMPYWAFAWAAGRALATFIQHHPYLVKNKVVLDLGTGSGLVAISAALAGAKSVYVHDLDPLALHAAHLNAALNHQTLYNWQQQPVDLLLASDLLYDISSHQSLQKLILQTPECLLAEPKQVSTHLPYSLHCLATQENQTFPPILDFDKALKINILYREI